MLLKKAVHLKAFCFLPVLSVIFFSTFVLSGCSAKTQELPAKESNQESAQAEPSRDTESAHGTDKPQHTNALADESSPYLLMHAHNPVDWYAWNADTLKKAQSENKLIFLSVGYSSCHWCHVMERESFLDEEIAKFLNENFVCIKVDREERPDVDQIYMESLNVYNQLTRNGQGGGWPLSMFLTPEGKPFFGGTYFPARDGDRGMRMGFLTIVKRLRESWEDDREKVKLTADQLTEITKKQLEGSVPNLDGPVSSSWMSETLEILKDSFDPEYGGFGYNKDNPQRPKFPEPSNLLFLAKWIRDHGDAKPELAASAKKMLFSSCEKMALGGMYDHLGGGFHRYSVDRFWAIPHFEKMLYDNGQLATVYSAAYEIDPKPELKRTVAGILEFVQREMTSPEGGFYSALDAESDGEEGKYYRWTKAEIESLLAGEELELFAKHYRINEAPNFEGKYYAPQLKETLDGETYDKLDSARMKLLAERSKRERPLLDNKILASWNGMMIRGFADAGRVFENPAYVDAAKKAARFALENLVDDQGRLKRTSTGGVAKLNGYLADYACMIDGLLAIHKATGEAEWVDAAKKIQAKQDELFSDPKSGGYFYTSADHEVLLIRSKRVADSERPSGSSVAATNLLYLAKVTGDKQYAEKANRTALSASGLMDDYPQIAPRMLMAVSEIIAGQKQ